MKIWYRRPLSDTHARFYYRWHGVKRNQQPLVSDDGVRIVPSTMLT